jgi:CO/xanthine dehydrogenase Mo-binding subunit
LSVGQRVAVLDASARVTGRIEFVLNRTQPGCLTGRVLRSPHAHALITHVDVSRAANLADVTVLTSAELHAWPGLDPYFGPLVADTPILAHQRVLYSGEPVVAVAAPDDDAAEEALALIEVEYEPLAAIVDAHAALRPEAPRLHAQGNLIEHLSLRQGGVERALAAADVLLTEEYRTPAVQGVPLEPHVVLASAEGSQVVVHSATQTPDVVRAQLARVFGLPLASVRVIGGPLGGGFGAKAYTRLEPVVLALALRARRPVKMVLSRAEEFVSTQRPAAWFRLTTGTAADGTLLALQAEGLYAGGASTEIMPRAVRHGLAGLVGCYRIPNLWLDVRGVFTNTPPCGPLRAPGGAQVHWARESHMDSIAARLGIDPVELRRKNLARNGERYFLGGQLEELHYSELLESVSGIGPPHPSPAKRRGRTLQWRVRPKELPEGEGVRTGRGVALSLVLINTPTTSTVSLKLNDDGSLSVLSSSVDMGQGAHTVLAQIAADELGIDMERISVAQPDTSVTPYDHATTSSRTTFSMGTAVVQAARSLKDQLVELAAEQLEARLDDLEVRDGRVGVRGAAERSLTFAHILRKARAGNLLASGTFTTTASADSRTGEPGASSQYHQAACRAEVSVDLATGKVQLIRLDGAVFAGRMVNPTLCELQAESNLVNGVGQALFEQLVYDGGQLTNPNLADYTIPAFRDMPPRVAFEHVEDLEHGALHGIGETLLPAVPPAIANAVFDACGARVRELPLSPERILRALGGSA